MAEEQPFNSHPAPTGVVTGGRAGSRYQAMNSRGTAIAEPTPRCAGRVPPPKVSHTNSHLPGSGTYGQPAAYLFMKQM
jgi:hypothetical protein